MLAAAIPPAGLVAWYRAEGDTRDWAYGNHAIGGEGTTVAAGKVGQAFRFDEAEDYVEAPHDPKQNVGQQITIEAWVYPDTLDHGRPIMQKRSSGNVGGFTLETTHSSIPGEPANGLQFVLWLGSSATATRLATPANALTVDQWQHVAATYDGASMKIYVNGIELASQPATGAIAPSNELLYIGRNVVIPSFTWDGLLDEVSLYNRALSQAEIQAILDADSEGKDPSAIVFRADFDSDPQVPSQFSGAAAAVPVQGYSAHGFSGNFLRNDSLPATPTTLTLTDLPPHEAIDLRFLLAAIDSWDGDQLPGQFFAPDHFNVAVDGNLVFSHTLVNTTSNTNTQTYVPPPGVELARRQQLGFNGDPTDHRDSAYNMGLDPAFQSIPHTASTLTVEWFASGSGFEGGTNESWAIDNVEVVVRGTEVGEPTTADVEVTIGDSPDPAPIGDSVTYSVNVTNHGPADATGVVVVAHGQAGQPFNNVTIPVGELASGESSAFQLVFTPAAVGTFSVMATVVAAEDDPNLANNSFTEITQVIPRLRFELAQAQYEVREGEEFAVLTVNRIGDLSGSASVEFDTANESAGQRGIRAGLLRVDDFTTTSGTLFFRPRAGTATIRVPIRDDGVLESDETFRVVLSNPSAGAQLGAIASATVVIHDNDPTVSFLAASSQRNESATSRGSIEVRLSPASNQSVTVTYAATGGTATEDADFTLGRFRTLTFRPGETRKFIDFTNVNDTLYEGNETAIIELVSATGAFLGIQNRHRVTIVDNDPVPLPPDPGATLDAALAIDLATVPRQSYRHFVVRTSGGINDIDIFRAHLDAGEAIVLDVDPEGNPGFFLAGISNSTLTVFGSDGTQLATANRSAEPDTGAVTNNAAMLFRAPASGDYYFQLQTNINGLFGYRLHFHRLGVSENVPSPELLNVAGPMLAWYDSAGGTVGITGPTGYGFTLAGPWQQQAAPDRRTGLVSQTLTLPAGSQFTMASPQGVVVPLIANGPIVIKTKAGRFGNVVGEVTTGAIKFPVALDIVPVNELLNDVFGPGFVSVGVLAGEWRISLGGEVFNLLGTPIERSDKVDELLPGVPYLRRFGGSTIDVLVGGIGLNVLQEPVHLIVDPADPSIYLRLAQQTTEGNRPVVAASKHGLLNYTPPDPPTIDLAASELFGHVFASVEINLRAKQIPGSGSSDFRFAINGDVVLNLDADRDGSMLGGIGDVDQVFDLLQGDIDAIRDILNDVQLGANGDLALDFDTLGLDFELGKGSLILNGLDESVWLRTSQTDEDFLAGTPLDWMGLGFQAVTEGLFDFGGEFFLATTTTTRQGGVELEYRIRISHEGIGARVTGRSEWSASIDFGGGTVSGKAIAEFEADIKIVIDDDGDSHLSGSVTAKGKLRGAGTTLFDGSIEASVKSGGLRFRFPRGVGSLDLALFD